MKLFLNHLIFSLILIFNFNISVNAQNNNDIIINKLESLERDIRDVQRKVYQSNDGELNTPPNNIDSSATAKGLANHELRLIEMEEQYRKTNGLVKELTFKIDKLEKDNNNLQNSINDLMDKLSDLSITSDNEDKTNLPINSDQNNSISSDNETTDTESPNVGVLARINPNGEDEIIQINPSNEVSQEILNNLSSLL